MTELSSGVSPGKDARTWGMICHLSALSGYLIPVPFANIVVPFAVWLAKRNSDPFIDHHGRESLNFQVTMLGVMILCAMLIPLFIGLILLPIVYIYSLVRVIIAAIRANDGEYYWYPRRIAFFN
jgi:uncharacterized Tic20 family protein